MWMSLSARRAWIEICSVYNMERLPGTSLSARRAWIEMRITTFEVIGNVVALRKESVDRNTESVSQ